MNGENKSAHLFGKFLLMLIFALLKRETVLDSVAQLVEQYTFNVWVLGSSPSGITKLPEKSGGFFVLRTCRKQDHEVENLKNWLR